MKVPAEARVDLDAIGDNIGVLRERAGGAEVMAMVKAEAYGHGLVEAARAALAGGASWLGVAKLAEALRLRDAGLTARTLVTLGVPGEPYEEAVARDVDLTVGAIWLLDEIVQAAERTGRQARVHLKADTGMSRGGVSGAEWEALVDAALKAEAAGPVRVAGVMSHFACADEPGHPSIAAQIGAFTEMVAHAEKAGARFEVRHLANSAATLTLPEARFDLVRPGIATYGLTPVPRLGTFGLRPAMTLVADAALVKRVPAGRGVSYGHTYTTREATNLAVVPVGYGDGIPRHGSNLLEVLAGGRRRTIAGRVCMDQFVIDLGDDRLSAGDEVILFGPGDRGEPTAQEWADALGTISYEIVTRIGSRVPRAYPGRAL
ncbi:alanine racemase [Actinomadura bangladeshensis]|uniref:Alanine racemase n=1 Tax=Actinomadura bangladeshensis TaxID=453573 RepID=A0A6L9QXN5_9ACTN|nr:alanine racemase [Actinomadura bangladeshensis]NEA28674.1 alanine racemase [Actinomadura bangladeshensis]